MTTSIIILMFLMAVSEGLDEEIAIQKMVARIDKLEDRDGRN